jgi:hypothetical protein
MYAKAPYTATQRAMHIHPTVAEYLPTILQSLPVHLRIHLATMADLHRAARYLRMSTDSLTLAGRTDFRKTRCVKQLMHFSTAAICARRDVVELIDTLKLEKDILAGLETLVKTAASYDETSRRWECHALTSQTLLRPSE